MHKWQKNEHGMTLVELLAAISLFAIFLGIVASFIMQLGNSEDTASARMTLVEDTNVLISELRHQYDDQSNAQICFDDESKRLAIKHYSIINGSGANETSLQLKDGCIENVDKELPLKIDLTTESSNGQTFSIQTAWEQHGKKNLNITVIEEDEEPDPEDDGDEPEDYLNYPEDGIQEGCILYFYGNTRFANEDIKKQDGKNEHICRIQVIDGHAKFDGYVDIKHDLVIEVDKNVYVNGHLNIGNGEKIKVGENLIINNTGTIHLKNKSKVIVEGNAEINGNIVLPGNHENNGNKHHGSICVNGQIESTKDIGEVFKCP